MTTYDKFLTITEGMTLLTFFKYYKECFFLYGFNFKEFINREYQAMLDIDRAMFDD